MIIIVFQHSNCKGKKQSHLTKRTQCSYHALPFANVNPNRARISKRQHVIAQPESIVFSLPIQAVV